jgi:TPP-dependent pyruvate/acetoin dehydrogenase alpha subunit
MIDKAELLYRCKRIRAIEEEIALRYAEQEMRCPTHLSVGQELVGAACGLILKKSDYAISTHRGHAHYLGKGGDLKPMLAEIYGKEAGCAKGRGGSMHLIDQSVGFMGTTAIVGNSIPIGVGLGLSIKLDGDDRVSCIFLGDAAIETGAFYESANFAAVRKLPVLFLCENNRYSVYSPLDERQPEGRKIHELVASIGLKTAYVDGGDAIATYQAMERILAHVRSGNGPALLEIETHRWREHCGPNYDDNLGYRCDNEVKIWRERDAQERLEKDLLRDGTLSKTQIEAMDARIKTEIDEAFDFAKQAPFPSPETAGQYEYAP